jgi:CheY-like chemotaxis protein
MYDRKKVLIVDDDEDARSFVEAILTSTGWDTLHAENGEDALDLAERESVDLIILDVAMPGMNGFEVFRRLRTSYTTKDVPIIMLTGINSSESGEKHSRESMVASLGVAGPDGFVDKPVDADFLMYTIGGVLG